MDKFAHFCQKCRAANDPGETSCRKCGTRLMIVTFPTSQRHEEEIVPPSYYEDHLLERVSLLEFRLKQVSEQLAMAYEFISRQSELFEKDHLLISSFMEAVSDIDPDLPGRLSRRMASAYRKKKGELADANRKKRELEEILEGHDSPNRELFSHLVREGVRLLEEGEEKQGFRTLERAALLSSANVPLQLFIAERLFAADKFEAAGKYLKRVFEMSPQNVKAMLLLGVIYADRNEPAKARKIVSVLAGLPETMVCANYIWGMLAASEGNWKEATVAFREADADGGAAEIDYLIGSACFQERQFKRSLEYFEKAVLRDKSFADAWYMVHVVCEILNRQSRSEMARRMAFEAKEAGARCLKFLGGKTTRREDLKMALAFAHFDERRERILTGGSLRMVRFFRKLVRDSVD